MGEPHDRPGRAPDRLRVYRYWPFGIGHGAGASGAGWPARYVGWPIRHGWIFRVAQDLEQFHGIFYRVGSNAWDIRYPRGGVPTEDDRLLRLVRYQRHVPEQMSDGDRKLISKYLDET